MPSGCVDLPKYKWKNSASVSKLRKDCYMGRGNWPYLKAVYSVVTIHCVVKVVCVQ